MCHKLDAVPDLTTVSRGKADDSLYLITSGIGGAQNIRHSLLVADQQHFSRQSGGDTDCLRAIDNRPRTLPSGEYTVAWLTILKRTASVD